MWVFFFPCTSVRKTSTGFFWPRWFGFFSVSQRGIFSSFFSPHLPDTHNGESLKPLLSFHSCSPYPCLNKTRPGLNLGRAPGINRFPPLVLIGRHGRRITMNRRGEVERKGASYLRSGSPLTSCLSAASAEAHRGSSRLRTRLHISQKKQSEEEKKKKNPSRNVP